MQKVVPFHKLGNCDLVVDTLYQGGRSGNISDDPISKIMNCGNQGGFRSVGTFEGFNLNYVILYTTLADPDWPDFLIHTLGISHTMVTIKSPVTNYMKRAKKAI